jgi:peptide methionine sulfoxide reductase MsrA
MFFGFHTPADPRWAGTQYRSAIFVYNDQQRKWAELALESRGALGNFVAIEDASDFYRAEEYHQKYVEKMTTTFMI